MRFLVLGSVNIDMTFRVDHIACAGETLSSNGLEINAGGKGANQSAALGKAGMEVCFAGKMGPDGSWILPILSAAGVDASLVISSDGIHTGQAIIQVDSIGQNCIILNAGGNKTFTESEIDSIIGGFSPGDAIVLQNEINNVSYAISKAAERGLIVVFNPSPFDSAIDTLPLDLVDIFFVNEIEGAALAGCFHVPADDKGFRSILEAIGRKYPKAVIVLTAGKNGAYCLDSERNVFFAPIVDYPVVDTTGAGDTFCGYFLASRALGKDCSESLMIASRASGIAVSRRGAMESMPSADEVFGE